jgi:hypothetical protein
MIFLFSIYRDYNADGYPILKSNCAERKLKISMGFRQYVYLN